MQEQVLVVEDGWMDGCGSITPRFGSVRTQVQAHRRNVKCNAYLPSSSYSWYSSVKRVQVVVAMMQDGCGRVRNARCVAADGENLGLCSLRPPLRPPDGSAAATHAFTHTQRERERERETRGSDRQLRGFSSSLSLFKYRTHSLL